MNILRRHIPAFAILSAAAVLIVPVSTLEPLWLTAVAALTTLAAIIEHASRGAWPQRQKTLTTLMAALVIWGAASIGWSIGPDRSISQAFELLLFALGATILVSLALGIDPAGRRQIETFLMIGLVGGLLFVLFELATDGIVHSALNGHFGPDGTRLTRAMNLFELNRAASVFSLVLWVTIIPVWRRFGWAAATTLVVITCLGISQLQPGAPVFAVIAGAFIFALAWFLPRMVLTILLISIVMGLAMIPFLHALHPVLTDMIRSVGLSEFSLHHRMAIWEFASNQAVAHPLLGWGLDSSRLIGEGQLVMVDDAPNIGFRNVDILPLHPHNALLQAWLELGAVGALILAALFAASAFQVRQCVHDRLDRAAAYAAYTAAFVTAQLSFGIWQGWWISTLALVAVLLTALIVRPEDSNAVGSA